MEGLAKARVHFYNDACTRCKFRLVGNALLHGFCGNNSRLDEIQPLARLGITWYIIISNG